MSPYYKSNKRLIDKNKKNNDFNLMMGGWKMPAFCSMLINIF